MRGWACLVLFVLLGCSRLSERSAAVPAPAAVPPAGPSASFAWAQSDGQRMAGNPDLIAHAQADIAECDCGAFSGGVKVSAQATRSMGGSVGFSASVGQPSTFLMVIWPDASSAQNSMAAVSAEGRTV